MEIPKSVIEKLEANARRLDFVFDSIWGLLPKTPERDLIMLNVLQAKTQLNNFIKENDTDGIQRND